MISVYHKKGRTIIMKKTEKECAIDEMVKDVGDLVCKDRLEIFDRLISAGWVKTKRIAK